MLVGQATLPADWHHYGLKCMVFNYFCWASSTSTIALMVSNEQGAARGHYMLLFCSIMLGYGGLMALAEASCD